VKKVSANGKEPQLQKRENACPEAPKEASTHAAPDARERIPTPAGGAAAQSYHFSGAYPMVRVGVFITSSLSI